MIKNQRKLANLRRKKTKKKIYLNTQGKSPNENLREKLQVPES